MRRREWSLASLAALCLVLPGCGVGEARLAGDGEPADEDAPLPVETTAAYRSDIYATFETTASIEADADAPVPARVPGEVVEILVEEGDRIAAGQVLARLDGARLALELDQARARLQMTTRELERMGRLEERGLVSAAMAEGLQFERDALKASFELMRLRYEYTQIRAPIAGVVSSREVKIGTHVLEGSPTFRITGTSRLVVHLQIPQIELSRISAGDEARVTVDALPDRRLKATIARLSPTIDARNGTFRATAYIDNEDGALAPGMFGRFSIAWDKHEGALLVPSDAVLREDNETVVYVVEEGAASRRAVQLGIETDGEVEILDGLSESEHVVVIGHGSLRDGSRVLASGAGSRTAG
jgi:membrane fusion protein (multidrug efflux system)